MRNLTNLGEEWRNFLYANSREVSDAEVENFMHQVDLINDSKEELFEEILQIDPDMEFVMDCKLEIAEQRKELEVIVRKFIFQTEVFRKKSDEEKEKEVKDFSSSLCKEGVNSYYYIVAEDWKEYG